MTERDEMIGELKSRTSDQMDRLTRSSEEQRSALEQHYRQLITELKSRNEVPSTTFKAFDTVALWVKPLCSYSPKYLGEKFAAPFSNQPLVIDWTVVVVGVLLLWAR